MHNVSDTTAYTANSDTDAKDTGVTFLLKSMYGVLKHLTVDVEDGGPPHILHQYPSKRHGDHGPCIGSCRKQDIEQVTRSSCKAGVSS